MSFAWRWIHLECISGPTKKICTNKSSTYFMPLSDFIDWQLDLPGGLYFCQLELASGERWVKKLVVQR